MEITDSEPPAQGFFFYDNMMPNIRFLGATREKLAQKSTMWAEKKPSSVRFLKHVSLNAIQKENGEEDEECSHICCGGGGSCGGRTVA